MTCVVQACDKPGSETCLYCEDWGRKPSLYCVAHMMDHVRSNATLSDAALNGYLGPKCPYDDCANWAACTWFMTHLMTTHPETVEKRMEHAAKIERWSDSEASMSLYHSTELIKSWSGCMEKHGHHRLEALPPSEQPKEKALPIKVKRQQTLTSIMKKKPADVPETEKTARSKTVAKKPAKKKKKTAPMKEDALPPLTRIENADGEVQQYIFFC